MQARIGTNLTLALLLVGLISAPRTADAVARSFGWTAASGGAKDNTPRGLFISKEADAIRVQVLDTSTGSPVSPSQEFKKDDELRVVIESNFQGYVYIIDVEKSQSGEKVLLLYPNPRATDNSIKPGAALPLVVTFDANPATETMQVIVAHDPISYLDSATKSNCSQSENRCELDRQAAERVSALLRNTPSSASGSEKGGVYARRPSTRPPRADQSVSEVRTRDIILAAGKDKDDAASTYVAIPVKGGTQPRLKSQEAFLFEIKLKHS